MVHSFKVLLSLALLGGVHLSSWAQAEWPKAKPVTLLVAFAPGASSDIVARSLTQKLNELTGGNFVVENRGGAGGNIASGQVKRAAPDGYTILVHSVAFAVNPSLYADAGYDALKDFVPVALGPKTPNIFTVNPSVAAKTLPELVEAAKKSPFSYASSGIGTTTHLSMERLKMAAKVDIVHVPYQPAAAVNAVVAGHTQIASTSMPPAVPMIKSGKLKAIALTSPGKLISAPDWPALADTFPGFDASPRLFVLAPAGTPTAVIARLDNAIKLMLAKTSVQETLIAQGATAVPSSAEELGVFMANEVKKWHGIVRSSGATVQ